MSLETETPAASGVGDSGDLDTQRNSGCPNGKVFLSNDQAKLRIIALILRFGVYGLRYERPVNLKYHQGTCTNRLRELAEVEMRS